MKEEKKDSGIFDHVPCMILSEKYKYLQRKVYQSLVFAAMRRRKFIVRKKLT